MAGAEKRIGMLKRLKGTASGRGRNVIVHPGNSSTRQVSYGRIRLEVQALMWIGF
jgi:hypothetical protein